MPGNRDPGEGVPGVPEPIPPLGGTLSSGILSADMVARGGSRDLWRSLDGTGPKASDRGSAPLLPDLFDLCCAEVALRGPNRMSA